MQKLTIAAFVLGSLTACATQNGNYTKISDAYNVKMADDTVQKLVVLYPPASTHLMLSQDAKDAYGVELVKKLRENGYAIKDDRASGHVFSSVPTIAKTSDSKTESSKTRENKKTSGAGSSTTISYIVDHVGEEFYSVKISIGSKVLSRGYRLSGNDIASAGSWTWRE